MKLERQNSSVYYDVVGNEHAVRIEACAVDWMEVGRHGHFPDREAIEAEIVRRVNCHDELVAVCRAILNTSSVAMGPIREMSREALAKAEGGAE